MEFHYTQERNVQILVSLLKAYGINKIIASPGSTDITFVASVQYDSFFKVYSCVDERSAAYMACGLADETGEPVVIVCTGATASRNYVPGLTEAYYRKLPVIAVTTSEPVERIGHLLPQLMDRTNIQNDIAIFSCNLQNISGPLDEWSVNINANKAISALFRNGGGPVHINLETCHNMKFDVRELPATKVIRRYFSIDKLPCMPKGKIAVFIGAHRKMTDAEVASIDAFCKANNAIVLADHTSRYNGNFSFPATLIGTQINGDSPIKDIDLMIHIGEVTGNYPVTWQLRPKAVWRVSLDGEMRDAFSHLTAVFEMQEQNFFDYYSNKSNPSDCSYIKKCKQLYESLYNKIPRDLPFSNIWVAKQLSPKFPKGCTIHLGILSSLRAYNFFCLDSSIDSISNTGGFGIDGCMSTLVGASLANPNKLYFGIFGDLSFFYDVNALGNRNVGKNLRIMLVNNGCGGEFRNFNHGAYQFGEDTNEFIAAGRHNGNRSRTLIRDVSKDLGFKYLCASNKEEFENVYDEFINPVIGEQPILFEVFTDVHDESDALRILSSLESATMSNKMQPLKIKAKSIAKDVMPPILVKTIKSLKK